jgi:hypothetical protein
MKRGKKIGYSALAWMIIAVTIIVEAILTYVALTKGLGLSF